VDDALFVAVPDSVQDGSDGLTSLSFTVGLFLNNPVKQLTALHKFKYEVELVSIVEKLY